MLIVTDPYGSGTNVEGSKRHHLALVEETVAFYGLNVEKCPNLSSISHTVSLNVNNTDRRSDGSNLSVDFGSIIRGFGDSRREVRRLLWLRRSASTHGMSPQPVQRATGTCMIELMRSARGRKARVNHGKHSTPISWTRNRRSLIT